MCDSDSSDIPAQFKNNYGIGNTEIDEYIHANYAHKLHKLDKK
jgi:hypothetical protein